MGHLAKAGGMDEVTLDAAAFMVAMKDVDIDKEFSRRLFEFLDTGTHLTNFLAMVLRQSLL